MDVVLGICLISAVFVACEKLLGNCLYVYSDVEDGKDSCRVSRIAVPESVTNSLPLLLGGIGLPLALASPLHGFLCLLAATLLWATGWTLRNRKWSCND